LEASTLNILHWSLSTQSFFFFEMILYRS